MLVDQLQWHDLAVLKGSGEEAEAPLTEAERASQWDSQYWERRDEPLPRSVRLFDEMGVGR